MRINGYIMSRLKDSSAARRVGTWGSREEVSDITYLPRYCIARCSSRQYLGSIK